MLDKNLIVHVPTKEDLIRVMEVALKEGFVWQCGNREINDNFWHTNGKNSCINTNGYCNDKEHFEKYSGSLIITAQEFVDMYTPLTATEVHMKMFRNCFRVEYVGAIINNKPMNKLSSAFKRLLNANLQAQVKAGLRNGDLMLTEKGKAELIELLAADKDKELTEIADEIIKEEEK
jgi:hypothetical protein